MKIRSHKRWEAEPRWNRFCEGRNLLAQYLRISSLTRLKENILGLFLRLDEGKVLYDKNP